MHSHQYAWVLLQICEIHGSVTIVGVYSNGAAARQVKAECELDAARSTGSWSYRLSCEPVLMRP